MAKSPFLALLLATALSGCSVGPDYEAPSFNFPGAWPWEATGPSAEEMKKTAITGDWWKSFNEPALTALIEEGLARNDDFRLAAARVAEARGLLNRRDADLYPDLDLQAEASRTGNSNASMMNGGNASSKPYNTFGLAAVFSYEIDIWGRLRHASESATAQLMSSQANRDSIRLAVASDIASGYFNLLALDGQITVTENTITAREEAFQYQQTQYEYGAADSLTFKQAEAELAAARAQLPILQQARYEQQTALGVLLGREPAELAKNTINRGQIIDALPNAPTLPSDLPSTLLERRPDLVAAEQSLIAANADIGVAKSDYFPRLSISALLGLDSADAGDLLSSAARKWSTGGLITAPLLGALRTSANVEQAEARKEQALATYEQTVRLAFKDVLDSLNAIETTTRRVDAETTHTNARSETVQQAQLRYDAGYSNYLEVLDAQRFLYQAQLDRITARRDRLNATISLYKALGGGWSIAQIGEDKPDTTPPAAKDKPAAPARKD